MTEQRNPFEYAGANDLPLQTVIDYYIEDFNYSRFIQSKRNVLLVGERGSGKSMTLIYNSWPLTCLKAQRSSQPVPTDTIGVYVPCKTPLILKDEYQLLDKPHAAVISEHHFVLSLAFAIAETLAEDPTLLEHADEDLIRSRLSFVLESDLPGNVPLFQAIMDFVQRESLRIQQAINDRRTPEVSYDRTYSFTSLIVPLLGCTRAIPRLQHTHFLLLIDDAHDLNNYQIAALSSWIAYRDHSLFSFKVALANMGRRKLHTSSGGSILEGHDFIRLDMVQSLHNDVSNFGRLAHLLVARRLERFQIKATPEEFFPISDHLKEELEHSADVVRAEADKRYGSNSKRVADYVYKYKRAHYFRTRPSKANRPEYSEFSTLVFLSTGVIRNLLIPCYWMYDKVLSLASEGRCIDEGITVIPPAVQSEIILDRSRKLWDWLRRGIDDIVVGCSRDDAVHCYHLLDQLAVHFRERLLKHVSEPRANSFTISGQEEDKMSDLNRIFEILGDAQLLYVRSGPAKEKGRREWYFVPNRMLWPERGLDPQGQHARVSLKAGDLWAAAHQNLAIPFDAANDDAQMGLFDVNE